MLAGAEKDFIAFELLDECILYYSPRQGSSTRGKKAWVNEMGVYAHDCTTLSLPNTVIAKTLT